MRKLFLVSLIVFLGTSLLQAQEAKKNVVLIVADDLGRDLGSYGNRVIRTPNLDQLAKKGVRFTNAYATVSSCSPSRASILTGLYTHQNGQYGLQHAPHSQQTHDWVRSLPGLLRGAGYWTGLIGKFHVGPDAVYPFESLKAKVPGRNVEAMAKLAREFISQREGRPFFLYYAFADPHRAAKGFGNDAAKEPAEARYDPKSVEIPYHLSDMPEVRQDLAEYYQSVSRMDRGVGLLLEILRETGQLENTLIIFISDNGIPFPAAKTTLYRAGIHLPLIIAAPSGPRDHTNHTLVSYIDLAPTILDWAKVPGPSYRLLGRSLLPILSEEKAKGWDEVFASHQFHEITMPYPMRALITTRYKYIANLTPEMTYPQAQDIWDSPSWQGIRKRGDKMMGQRNLASYLHRPKEELYDLDTDPNELKNLAGETAQREILLSLRQRLRTWQAETRDPWLVYDREEK